MFMDEIFIIFEIILLFMSKISAFVNLELLFLDIFFNLAILI